MAESQSQGSHKSRGTTASPPGARASRVLLGALAIALASAILGLVVNHLSPRRIPLLPRPTRGGAGLSLPSPAVPLPPGLVAMTLEQARAAFDAQSALFLDARKPEEYEQGHIPGARNLPPRGFEDRYLEVAEAVEAATSVVVYCEGVECSDAIETGERLLETGRKQVYIFESGWRAWVGARGPVREGPEP